MMHLGGRRFAAGPCVWAPVDEPGAVAAGAIGVHADDDSLTNGGDSTYSKFVVELVHEAF